MSKEVELAGETYHAREQLKLLFGARWNGRAWTVSADQAEEAQTFVNKHGAKYRYMQWAKEAAVTEERARLQEIVQAVLDKLTAEVTSIA